MIDLHEVIEAENLDELRKMKIWISQEDRRLKEERYFVEQKMEFLKDGFKRLEEERQKFEQEKQHYTSQKVSSYELSIEDTSCAELLFRSAVGNPLALRKRYRDLVKIFHPDNLFGDAELVQMINDEFSRCKGAEDN